METKDRAKLRAAAEKATKGPWKQMTGKVVAAAYIVAECDFADARFIALTDPDTAIALLDALDEAEKEKTVLRDANGDLAFRWAAVSDENTRLRKALKRMVDDARLENDRLVSRAAIIQGEEALTRKGGNNE